MWKQVEFSKQVNINDVGFVSFLFHFNNIFKNLQYFLWKSKYQTQWLDLQWQE